MNDVSSSSRASGAPRQKWTPAPNDTCGLGSRATSSSSGCDEHACVAVGGAEEQPELGPFRHRRAADLRVLEHPPLEHLQRRVPSHQLLDGPRSQRSVCSRSRASCAGLRNSDHHPLPGDVHRGLVAGVQQQHARPDQLVLGEALAVVDDLRERADEVVARCRAALPRQRSKVVGELDAGAHRGARRLLRRLKLVHPADVGGPGPQQWRDRPSVHRGARRSRPPAAARRAWRSDRTPRHR